MGVFLKIFLDNHGGFNCVSRGQILVKGKGLMETYWLSDATRSNGN